MVYKRITAGQNYYPAGVGAVLDKEGSIPAIGEKLTQRELEVYKLLVASKNRQEIAEILSISEHTVKHHRRRIYLKCGGNTPVDLLRNGLIKGLISEEDL